MMKKNQIITRILLFVFFFFSYYGYSQKSREFSPDISSGIRLGELVDLKGHPKSKGVNIQLKAPLGWDINEGNNPNVIKTFSKYDGEYMYAVLIKDNITFYSRDRAKKILNDTSYTNGLIGGIFRGIRDPKILNKTIMTVANYPTLYVECSGIMEYFGADIEMYNYCWLIFYEDKVINLMGRAFDKEYFNKLKPIYYKITSSVVLPDQFN